MATPSSRFFTRTASIYRKERTGLQLTAPDVIFADIPASPLWPFDTDYESYEITKTFRNMYSIYTSVVSVYPGDYVMVDTTLYEISRVNNYGDFLELHVYGEVV